MGLKVLRVLTFTKQETDTLTMMYTKAAKGQSEDELVVKKGRRRGAQTLKNTANEFYVFAVSNAKLRKKFGYDFVCWRRRRRLLMKYAIFRQQQMPSECSLLIQNWA